MSAADRLSPGQNGIPGHIRAAIAAHRMWIDSDGRQGARAELQDGDLRDLDLTGVELSGADLSGADLRGVCLDDARFRLATLRGVHLDGASITRACFDGANLDRAILDRARVTDSSFDPIELFRPDRDRAHSEVTVRMVGVRCRRAVLRNSTFRHADMRSVKLERAELVDCDFEGAYMEPAARACALAANCRVLATPTVSPVETATLNAFYAGVGLQSSTG